MRTNRLSLQRIVLVRAGRTRLSAERRFCGHADPPLDERGRWEADALAQRLASEWRPGLVLASAAWRATDTARAIAAWSRCTWDAWPGLADVDVGDWEGLTRDEARSRDPAVFGRWFTSPAAVGFPGGERLLELRVRARALLDEVSARAPTGVVAVVGHDGINRAILLAALGLPLSHYHRLRQATGCLNVIAPNRFGHVVLTLNDTGHLR